MSLYLNEYIKEPSLILVDRGTDKLAWNHDIALYSGWWILPYNRPESPVGWCPFLIF